MTTEIIEGVAVPMESAVAVVETREMLNETATPEGTVSLATRMATALKDIVEKQRLYAVIQGKKFPQVEAWMTIARMDNVVCREVPKGITRHEDGSYEAEVELIRLSDGMVIGYGSALCGSKGDKPWDTRPEPARRSMAVTRATSRAFRQQYSWIMALAGYEPTPAEEMPRDDRLDLGRPELERRADGLVGTVAVGKPPVDLQLRETPDGHAFGFKLMAGRKGYQALAVGMLANALWDATDGDFIGTTVTVWGRVEMIPWDKKDPATGEMKAMPPYARVAIERVSTPDWTLPDDAAVVANVGEEDLSGLDF